MSNLRALWAAIRDRSRTWPDPIIDCLEQLTADLQQGTGRRK